MASIECQICLQNMVGRNPRALPCLHTFCESCLMPLQKLDIPKCPFCSRNSPDGYCTSCQFYFEMGHNTVMYICCPTCRFESTLPEGGVQGLPLNFLINQMSELHIQRSQHCHRCKTVDGSFACETCLKTLCIKCKERHDSIPAFSTHSIRQLDKDVRCPEHQEEAIYVCVTCAVRICAECVLSDDHHMHKDNILEYKTWLEVEKGQIFKMQSELKPKLRTFESELQEMRQYKDNIGKTISTVNDTANQMKQKIDKDRNWMTNKLTQERRRVTDVITKMEQISSDAVSFSAVKEENLNPASIVREMLDARRKGEALLHSAAQVPCLKKTWFTFEPETLKTLGILKMSDSKTQ